MCPSERDANGTRGDLEFATIAALPEIAAARHGTRVAIADGSAQLTFEGLRDAVRRAAAALIAAHVRHGDRVAIWAPNTWEWVVAALGAHTIGAAIVPLNTRYKAREAAYVLGRSRARVLFTVNGFLETDYAASLRAIASPDLSLERIVLLRGDPAPGTEPWADFIASGRAVSDAEVERHRRAVRPDDVADVLFTSGTTGAPKGALCTHAQNLRAFRDWADTVGLCAADRYMIVAPFFHAFGYKAGWLAALMTGATILPVPLFDAGAVLRQIGPERVTVLPGPPALYQTILQRRDLAGFDLSSLRLAVTGAAVIPLELVSEMRSVLGFETIVTGYGLTESTGVATMCRHDDPLETIARTSGRALPGVEVRVVDPSGTATPVGAPGEVLIRGYNVMTGYLDDPEATRAAIDPDGWLHTGDVGVLDERGYLRITDRLKDMFIVGGFNAYPAEIENVILTHPAVAQAAVVGVPDARLGEVGKAYVVVRPGATLSESELIAWCRDAMANFKVPRSIALVSDLPRNASGKVQKFLLRSSRDG